VCPAFALLVALLGFGATAQAQSGPYTFTKIKYPGSTSTEASGINNAGQIVGTYLDAQGFTHGFVFDGSTYTRVAFPGAAHNYAFGINDSGHIVGGHAAANALTDPWHGFSAQGGVFTQWDFPGFETDGRGINGAGDIVGIYNSGLGTQDHGFMRIGDEYTSLDYPGAAKTYAFGINDSQLVTGSYVDAFGLLRGYWFRNGVFSAVNFPGATQTYVGGLNNQNVMVGWSQQNGRRFGYTLAGTTSFRGFTVGLPGVTASMPKAINSNGQIVGAYYSSDCPTGCGFLATPNPAGTPTCSQAVSMTYANGQLALKFNLTAAVPTTWTTYLFVRNVPYKLWSSSLPVVTGGVATVPVTLSPQGTVHLLSMLSTAAGGTVCADYASLNTGPL
jgi:probable HAF family extracellular repeat protein